MIREAILKTSELSCLSQVASYLGGTGLQGPGKQIGFKGRGAGPFGILVHVAWHHLMSWGFTSMLWCYGSSVASLGGPRSGLICAQQDHRGMAISTQISKDRASQQLSICDPSLGSLDGGAQAEKTPWGQGHPQM